jgi:hypothetical protein
VVILSFGLSSNSQIGNDGKGVEPHPPVMPRDDAAWRYTALVLIVLAFLASVWPGLSAGFDGDDLMNLHEAAEKNTLRQLLVGSVFPFTSINRPTGEVYYRILYWLFGWHPLAFRLVTYAFMAANVALVYGIARRLASSEAGLLAALLYAFHGRLWQIYMSNGTIYDVLCTFFSLLALQYYIEARMRYGVLGWRKWAVLTLIFTAALNAKEMAAVLPVLFLIYDWVCAAPERRFTARARWMVTNSWPAVALGLGALASFWGKTRSGGPFNTPAYEMSFTVKAYFFTARFYFSELFYLRPHRLIGRHIVFLFALLFALAALARRRSLWFLAWFAVLAPLPVLFIPPRSFFAMYLPLAGWAIFAATALTWARDRLFRRSVHRPFAKLLPLGVCVLAIVYGLADPEFRMRTSADYPMPGFIELSKQDFIRLNEPLPQGASILLLGSRFPAEANPYFPLMIAQVLYRDRTLVLDRAELMNPRPGPAEFQQYDRVIAFDGANLNVLVRSGAPGRATRLPSSSPAWWR